MRERSLARLNLIREGLEFRDVELQVPQQNPAPSARPVPFIPGASNPNRQATVALKLRRVLQYGKNNIAQVWTTSPVEAPETVLALKIIQPSMSWWYGDSENTGLGYYVPPRELAAGGSRAAGGPARRCLLFLRTVDGV